MKAFVAELADLLRGVADGTPPPTDSDLTVVLPPDERSVGVLAFPGQHIIVADVRGDWVRSWLPDDDLSAPLGPPFLTLLSAVTGREIDNLDSVLVARAHGRRRGLELAEVTDSDHPRLARARLHRADVRAWVCPGGLLVIGRGVAGRWEVAVEVEPALRGFGLGRGLFGAALGLLPEGESVWAQVAPGNAASLRALLASGYRPVGAEVLLRPRTELAQDEPIEWFGSYLPVEEWDEEQAEPEPAEVASHAASSEPEPPAAEPPAAEPDPAEPDVAETQAEPDATGPDATGPDATEPRIAEPLAELPVEAEPPAEAASAAEAGPPAELPVEATPAPVFVPGDEPFEPVHFRLPPIEVAPRPVAGDRRPIESHTAEELAAAEAEAAAELDEDEDTELAERDEPNP
jgi:GNAT superfamily N-acetyltransferase